MPLYEYSCTDCGNFEIFYKSLPSEAKQKAAPCPDCDKSASRLLGSFYAGNSQTTGIEVAMGNNALQVDVGGRKRPAYRDANGQMHEVKSEADIRNWQKSNQYGTPRMVSWRNPKTGEQSMVPQRVKMIADPVSGEPMDAPVIRESVDLVPIEHFDMPSETKSGIPIDPKTGVPKVRNIGDIPIGPKGRTLVDPDTGKPLKISMWGDEPGFSGDNSRVRAVLKKK